MRTASRRTTSLRGARRHAAVRAARRDRTGESAATRSTCSTRWPPDPPAAGSIGPRSVTGARARVRTRSGWRRTPRSCCCRPAGSSAAAASCWRPTCAHGGGLLLAAGPDVDGDVVGRRARRRVDRCASPGAPTRSRRRASLAPADVRHPVFQAFAAGSGDARSGDVSTRPASAAPPARRSRASRPAKRR